MSGDEYLLLVTITPDDRNHLKIREQKKCRDCSLKACLYVCPSGVFQWEETREELIVLWERCIECGACEQACPENIEYNHPRGGFGVTYYS